MLIASFKDYRVVAKMKLTDAQIKQLETDGFIIIPERFTQAEVAAIRSRLPQIFSQHHEANIIERNSGVVRTAMGLHLRDNLFAALVRHPRLIGPAQQLFGEPMYAQQVKVNVKAAFSGEMWQWHADFATHHEEDGVTLPRALNLHILLDEVTEFNGPLYFLPGSHRAGDHAAKLDNKTTSYTLWATDHARVREMAERGGIVAAKGRPGTMLIFHDTLIHGSPNNMSPWDRSIFSLIVNPVSNAYTAPTRPDYKHHRNLTPLEPLAEDCLETYVNRLRAPAA
ncbi:phytanoyl-CoA dioxygenase family protein [Limibacillus halophilus]|uniref:Ectoine hydroxylase n=1 Tax=Limibacillus halophilus TaxID=1579333 RepID=A0A839SPA1_9PROT|nr:phytanoyl-CoA dioxygenase family protein [Limibacillus halophilus]MBB3063749.1 ectoine hydroxylase [Limibacillus halophilus]